MNGDIRYPHTDAEGRATFTGLSAWKLTVWARFGLVTGNVVPPAPVQVVPADQEVELRFRKAKLCRWRVLLPDGSPVRGAEIRFLTADGARLYARSGKDGLFHVAMLPGQPHALRAEYEAMDRTKYRAWREGVMPGDVEREIQLELAGY